MDRNSDRLLSDILGEAGELREALLNRTLRQVKRRRTIRRVRRAGSVLLLLLLPVVLLVRRVQLPPVPEAAHGQLPYVLVRTAPLPSSALIETRPFAPSGVVASAPSLSVANISSHGEVRGYREIDDATLLALAGTNAAVLVRSGPHSAELVFVSGTNAPQMND
jgi:hypothetical protein